MRLRFFLRRFKLVVTSRVYCYQCLDEPAIGFSQDGVDLCVPCWDDAWWGIIHWPPAEGRGWRVLRAIVEHPREWKRKVRHLHDWELEDVEDTWGNSLGRCWSCFGCCAALPEDSRWHWRWNPFVEWH